MNKRKMTDNDKVVPLQYLGVFDVDLSKVYTSELMLYALAKLEGDQKDEEGGYAFHPSYQPVTDFGRPHPAYPAC